MRCIIIIFLLFNTLFIFSQNKQDIQKLECLEDVSKSTEYKYTIFADNEIDLIFINAFIFYKKHLSSHDYGKCNFTPSCSEYALEAINKQGVVLGIINFFDRFSRCNGLNHTDYKIDSQKKILYDPVE